MTDINTVVGAEQRMTGTQVSNAAATPVVHPVVAQVVQQVYNDPRVPPEQAAYTAATALSMIQQIAPAALVISRSNPTTALEVNAGIFVMSALISAFFPHPKQ